VTGEIDGRPAGGPRVAVGLVRMRSTFRVPTRARGKGTPCTATRECAAMPHASRAERNYRMHGGRARPKNGRRPGKVSPREVETRVYANPPVAERRRMRAVIAEFGKVLKALRARATA
jgi:hypothetical protein